jgi:DNA mismatch repair protein MutS
LAKNRTVIKSAGAEKETPLMKQYNAIKSKYPDALLLFRVGDFYETFGDDAVKTAKTLGIVLTKRNNGAAGEMNLAGFPHHALDMYLPKLVRAGYRVAICDQLEDPKLAKGIVKRGVTELVTPGVTYNEKVLENKSNNFLSAIHFGEKYTGISFLDVSTGEFFATQGKNEYIDKLLQSFKPGEVLYKRNENKKFNEIFGSHFYTYKLDDWVFTHDYGNEKLLSHFQTKSLKGFGIEDMPEAIVAAGAALHYLEATQHDKTAHITSLARIDEDKYVWLDKFTIRNLELIHPAHPNAKTLLEVLDFTITPMGSRLLKRWMLMPLLDIQSINQRLDVVDFFTKNENIREQLKSIYEQTGDLERLISKVAVGRISPREMTQLNRALKIIPQLKEICSNSRIQALKIFSDQLNPCTVISEKIDKELNPEAPVAIGKGTTIKSGVNNELDDLRNLSYSGKDYLLQIQTRESERTGIPSLKIAFNNVFGYYLEVTNTHKNKVPADWIRKQTLANAERYITEELKAYETKILGAEEKILMLETQLYNELVFALSEYIQPIQHNAYIIAQIDCLLSFATAALQNAYTRPQLNDSYTIQIKNGRHPVIEKALPPEEQYVANDLYLDNDKQQIIMITGPNMSGKSALLRQTALIVLMAQMGSFVPAQFAELGLIDKVFTRVGASDNISSGESTFMVEMNETASILHNITNRSLVLLDEIGRGTSTYDGISIAWAIAEYLHENNKARPKTLFATHYHELNDMAALFNRIKNFNVSVKELNHKIIFMRKLEQGGSRHSFGIHVAKMAGMPVKVLERANQILAQLESNRNTGKPENITHTKKTTEDTLQLSFFQLDDPVLQQIKEEILKTDINTLTPVEALMKLNEIKKLIGG